MAMRNHYWQNETQSERIDDEKTFLKDFLNQHQVFKDPNLDDVKYFFFSLPSIIILKAYALGFMHELVIAMMNRFIEENKKNLCSRMQLKVQYNI